VGNVRWSVSVLQRVAVYCSVLQCATVCCRVAGCGMMCFCSTPAFRREAPQSLTHPFSLTHTHTHKHTHTHAHTLRSPLSPLSRSHICIDTRNKRLAVMQCFDCRNHLGLLGEPGFQPYKYRAMLSFFLAQADFPRVHFVVTCMYFNSSIATHRDRDGSR